MFVRFWGAKKWAKWLLATCEKRRGSEASVTGLLASLPSPSLSLWVLDQKLQAHQQVAELVSINIVSHLEVPIQQGRGACRTGLLLDHGGVEMHVTLEPPRGHGINGMCTCPQDVGRVGGVCVCICMVYVYMDTELSSGDPLTVSQGDTPSGWWEKRPIALLKCKVFQNFMEKNVCLEKNVA